MKYNDIEDDNITDDDENEFSSDEFGIKQQYDDQSLVTGRMRKKNVARSKGGEFQNRRQKRRLYCCCISSLIKIQDLYDHLVREIFSSKSIWTITHYADVLILAKSQPHHNNEPTSARKRSSRLKTKEDISIHITDEINMTNPENQVVFVFEFGAIIFWGFSNGEERNLLSLFTQFTNKEQRYFGQEFNKGEDDMAFVTSLNSSNIHISNDMIILPSSYQPTFELLLSQSYAISQSAVVSIFEYKIEQKLSEYKYIPEALSKGEIINLSSDNLGMMLGDIFRLQYELNLYSDILDTPDALWATKDEYLLIYDQIFRYLEIESRVILINKRLNIQKDVLQMLQQHFHSAHMGYLDTIIIWLLALEVIVQVFGGGGMLLGFWGNHHQIE